MAAIDLQPVLCGDTLPFVELVKGIAFNKSEDDLAFRTVVTRRRIQLGLHLVRQSNDTVTTFILQAAKKILLSNGHFFGDPATLNNTNSQSD